MDKKEYLFKTLSRTKRKDDENYVINAVFNRVNNFELKPVSQQYVNCGDSWFLIDLFFPQINVGIEVDEEGHINQIEKDEIRSDQIVSAMKYENRSDFEMLRVQTYNRTIDEVNNSVAQVVNHIQAKIDESDIALHWNIREEDILNIRKKQKLSIFDDVAFSSITQTINELFDWGRKSSGGPSRVWFKYKPDPQYNLWFAKRNVFKNNKEIAQAGWINRLSRDGKTILEFRDDIEEVDEVSVLTRKYFEETDDKRITFLKFKSNLGENGYKFVGVFKRDGWEITTFNNKKVKATRYSRIQDYIDLPELKK